MIGRTFLCGVYIPSSGIKPVAQKGDSYVRNRHLHPAARQELCRAGGAPPLFPDGGAGNAVRTGKTTLFKLLLGFLRPTAGSAAVLGLDCLRQTAEVLRHTGCLIETPVFYEHLSAAENLRLHLACMECSADPAPLLARVGLDCADDRPVRAYSLGMRQRLALARALSHRPEVLILDEPINGLDPVGQRETAALFRQLSRAEGRTILFSSHQLAGAAELADRIGVLAGGRLVLEADTPALRRRFPGRLEEGLIEAMEGRDAE